MAWAFDAKSEGSTSTTSTTLAFNHTCGASADLLVVCVGYYNSDQSTQNITALTYNSVAMTQAVKKVHSTRAGMMIEIYYLLAPDTGSAYSVSITYDLGMTASIATALSYSGIQQSSTLGVTGSGEASASTSVSATPTSTTDNSLIVSCVMAEGGDTDPFSSSNSETERTDSATGTSTAADVGFWVGDKNVATAGSFTTGASYAVTDEAVLATAEFKELVESSRRVLVIT